MCECEECVSAVISGSVGIDCEVAMLNKTVAFRLNQCDSVHMIRYKKEENLLKMEFVRLCVLMEKKKICMSFYYLLPQPPRQ